MNVPLLNGLHSRRQWLFLKSIVEILTDDYPPEILHDVIKTRLIEYKDVCSQISRLLGGKGDKGKEITDEYVDKFIEKVRREYEIFVIHGRIKIARKGSRLYYIYSRLQGLESDI